MNNRPSQEYWNKHYQKNGAQNGRSLFAEFVLESFPLGSLIIDVGCGDGRDTLYFSSKGFKCLGLDWSPTGLDSARRLNSKNRTTATFATLDFSSAISEQVQVNELIYELKNSIGSGNPSPLVIYARFLFHAISEQSESHILQWLSELMTIDDVAFFEYRVKEDEYEEKYYDNHFRRFISSEHLRSVAAIYGFDLKTISMGKGLSPFHGEDPFLIRQEMRKKVSTESSIDIS